jgi:hypothetical protein
MRIKNPSEPHLRLQIAQLAARLIVQEGINDYQIAKNKAVAHLGIPHTKNLPSNSEIEQEILIYQRLFQGEAHTQHVQKLREVAVKAMRLFKDFSPRLVGNVLEGTAHQYSEVQLHLFTDTPEHVAFFLMQHNIPYEMGEKKYRLAGQAIINFPSYHFMAGEHHIRLVIFAEKDIRWSPPSPIDNKPMRRADLRAVETLLQDHSQ